MAYNDDQQANVTLIDYDDGKDGSLKVVVGLDTHTCKLRDADEPNNAVFDVVGDRNLLVAAVYAWDGEAEFSMKIGDLRKYSHGWY